MKTVDILRDQTVELSTPLEFNERSVTVVGLRLPSREFETLASPAPHAPRATIPAPALAFFKKSRRSIVIRLSHRGWG